MNWFLYSLSKYSDFSGRARRREYAWFGFFSFLLILVLAIIDHFLGFFSLELGMGVLSGIGCLAIFLPSLAVSIRRLHDHNASGWWVLLCIIPIVSFLFGLFMVFAQGNEGENRFGPDPRANPEANNDATAPPPENPPVE